MSYLVPVLYPVIILVIQSHF